MPTQPEQPSDKDKWREAVIEVESLRQEYEELLGDPDTDMDDPAVGRLWLHLWLAERRRDELLRAPDRS
jgi:hypothetical protein